MNPQDYPALYRDADIAAVRAQRAYLRSLQLEYVLLFVASLFSLNLAANRTYYAGYALTFLTLIGIVAYRTFVSPEQSWYRARALAESIKTSTFRFVMRAPPFDKPDSSELARQAFRAHLLSILHANPEIGTALTGASTGQQVTPAMEAIRALPLAERKILYHRQRIEEQRAWYVSRAARNRRSFRIWVTLLVLVYSLGTTAALSRVAFPNLTWIALDPLIVLGASLVGWIQVKKFSELAASYALTAHEIGIVESRAADVAGETDFADFVNEAELAFSREHTQWVARQGSGP